MIVSKKHGIVWLYIERNYQESYEEGKATYQVYTKNLTSDVSDVDWDHLALSMI